jgi:hypothetical protein
MSDFNIGDRVEISYHIERKYIGQKGKITYAGYSLMEGTAPSDFRQVDVDEESRYLIQLDNGEILNELRAVQLLKL